MEPYFHFCSSGVLQKLFLHAYNVLPVWQDTIARGSIFSICHRHEMLFIDRTIVVTQHLLEALFLSVKTYKTFHTSSVQCFCLLFYISCWAGFLLSLVFKPLWHCALKLDTAFLCKSILIYNNGLFAITWYLDQNRQILFCP